MASVYKFARRYVVHAKSRGRTGLFQNCEPYIGVPLDDDGSGLAAALESALEASSNQFPPRAGFRSEARPLFRLAGITSWSKFDPLALCDVELGDDGTLRLMPLRRDGAGHGPVPRAKHVLPPGASGATLVKELFKALAASERHYLKRGKKR